MSKSNGTTRVVIFEGWAVAVPGSEGFFELLDDGPSSDMDGAATSAGLVGWTNRFTGCMPGDRVILRSDIGASVAQGKWVLAGLA